MPIMSEVIYTYLPKCNQCGALATNVSEDEQQAIDAARAEGWSIRKRGKGMLGIPFWYCLCKECTERAQKGH